MIDHRRASRLLADRLAGELTAARRAELDEHVAGCTECRDWSETYEFLSAALSGDPETEHPSSEQLAHLAVDATLLTAPERDRLADHLEACADCRRELELSREALTAARRPATVTRLPLRLPSPAVARRWALAASLILALAVTFVALRPDGAERGPQMAAMSGKPHPEATPPAAVPPDGAFGEPAPLEAAAPEAAAPDAVRPATVPAASVPPPTEPPPAEPRDAPAGTEPAAAVVADQSVRRLAGDRLEGSRLIEAPGTINASATTIGSDSAITLRAGRMVVLGDGFSIASSATLGVEIAAQPAVEPASASHS